MTLTPEQIERRAQLSAALRSGKYSQTEGCLRRGDCFCVFGVAADVMDPSGWAHPADGIWEYNNHFAVIPREVRSFYGISDNESTTMLDANDHNHVSFPTLADMLDTMTQERINA